MTALLAPKAADRLAKLCGMLGSAHDGERAAAAAKATELLHASGVTWRDLVEAAFATPTNDDSADQETDWREIIATTLDNPPTLYDGELKFLTDMLAMVRRGRMPSPKQAAWLEKIARRN